MSSSGTVWEKRRGEAERVYVRMRPRMPQGASPYSIAFSKEGVLGWPKAEVGTLLVLATKARWREARD